MTVAFPNTFKDGTGEVASGKKVMENLNVLKAALDPWMDTARNYGATVTLPLTDPTTGLLHSSEILLSATRAAFVHFHIATAEGAAFTFQLSIGGVVMPELSEDSHDPANRKFTHYGVVVVPANQKFKVDATGLNATYPTQYIYYLI